MTKTYVSGTDNEKNIVDAINGKNFCNLNTNLQNFIKELFPEVYDNDVLKANKLGGIYKKDFEIILNDKKVGVSLKKGVRQQCTSRKSRRFYTFSKNNW